MVAQAQGPVERAATHSAWAWFETAIGKSEREASTEDFKAAARKATNHTSDKPLSRAHITLDQAQVGIDVFSKLVDNNVSGALNIGFEKADTFKDWIQPWIEADGAYELPVSDEMKPMLMTAGEYAGKNCQSEIKPPGFNKLILLPSPPDSVSAKKYACILMYDAGLVYLRFVIRSLPAATLMTNTLVRPETNR